MVTRIKLRAPVIFLVLAAIAIPIELQWPRLNPIDWSINGVSHVFVNVMGFVPVGLVLGEFGVLRALAAAILMSGFAETAQMAMLYRDPSLSDFIANVIGGFLGAVIIARWKIHLPARYTGNLRISKWTAFIAAPVAFALMAQLWVAKGPAVSTRGTTSLGALEGYWRLDETGGRVASDSSGHNLNGQFSREFKLASGLMGNSIVFDGKKEYVDVGRSTALRLAGSMTITAWINSSSFPWDDAAIVSQWHIPAGFQFDTTVDKGPRTVGFKLSNACEEPMARYGATPLVVGTWYHVAGVYDAPRRTLDVYLNGNLDNGPLVGWVTSTQHSSRLPVYIGRRSDLKGFEFAGSIRDVRIYSLALTKEEIAAVMRGETINRASTDPISGKASETEPGTDQSPQCAVISEKGDEWIPLKAASLGVLAAVASIALWPSASPLLHVFFSFVAGLLLLPAVAPNAPAFNLWLIPIVTLGGGVSVVASARRDTGPKMAT